MKREKKIVLSIAGSDPFGGAGIQADIKTAVRIGLYPCSVITAITAQNSTEFINLWGVGTDQLNAQLKAVLEDVRPDAVKIGLVTSTDDVDIISEAISCYELFNVVVDPVLSPTLSRNHTDNTVIKTLAEKIFPLATIVTPNIPEKELIEQVTGQPMEKLCDAFLLKGGHKKGNDHVDVLFYHSSSFYEPTDFQSSAFPSINNNNQPHMPHDSYSGMVDKGILMEKKFSHKHIETSNTHGSGCVLSTAIACFLAKGHNMEKAVAHAIDFTYESMKSSSSYKIGNGDYGPVLI